jgi:hypothetical protein
MVSLIQMLAVARCWHQCLQSGECRIPRPTPDLRSPERGLMVMSTRLDAADSFDPLHPKL